MYALHVDAIVSLSADSQDTQNNYNVIYIPFLFLVLFRNCSRSLPLEIYNANYLCQTSVNMQNYDNG